MGELGGTVEYLYWSARRTGRFVEDNNLAAQQVAWTIATPALRWLPSLSRTATSSGSLRPQVARTIERALGQIAVTRFNAPGPIKYAKGTSSVAFGEFKTWMVKPERQPAVMFTAVDYDRRDRGSVAVCLFGSMDNFPEYVQQAGPGFRDGWVSSAAPAVFNFIESHGEQFDDPYFEEGDMAVEALRIADGQGLSEAFTSEHDALGTDRPWQRAFTYGAVPKAQWLAQIYLDVDLLATDNGREDGFRRVLIGVPLWIRTPDPQAVKLYAMSDSADVVEARRIRVKRGGARAEKDSPRASTDRAGGTSGVAVVVQEEEEEPQKAASEGRTITLPYRVYGTLKAGFVKGEADWVMREVVDMPADDRVFHLGDPFGRVFAWVWNDDKDVAMILLSDYLAELREGHLLAEKIDPPIRLDEVLRGLRLALPFGFSDYDEVVTKARREVRRYYGADPNA
jgi:hypothetical protein